MIKTLLMFTILIGCTLIAGAQTPATNTIVINGKLYLITPPVISTNTLMVLNVLGNAGAGEKCFVRFDSGKTNVIIISNLPKETMNYFNVLRDADSRIASMSGALQSAQRNVDRRDAIAPIAAGGSPEYVNRAMAERDAVNLSQVNINHANQDLATLRADRNKFEEDNRPYITQKVIFTKTYGGMGVYKVVKP